MIRSTRSSLVYLSLFLLLSGELATLHQPSACQFPSASPKLNTPRLSDATTHPTPAPSASALALALALARLFNGNSRLPLYAISIYSWSSSQPRSRLEYGNAGRRPFSPVLAGQPASYMYEDTYLPRSKRQVILKLACVWDLHQRTCLGPPYLQLAAPTRSTPRRASASIFSLLTIRMEVKERRVYWAIGHPVSSDFCSAFGAAAAPQLLHIAHLSLDPDPSLHFAPARANPKNDDNDICWKDDDCALATRCHSRPPSRVEHRSSWDFRLPCSPELPRLFLVC